MTENYFVFEIYYNHKTHAIRDLSTESELQEYLIMRILDDYRWFDFDENKSITYYQRPLIVPRISLDNKQKHLYTLPLKDLVDLAIRLGTSSIDYQPGFGIVKVIKGISL